MKRPARLKLRFASAHLSVLLLILDTALSSTAAARMLTDTKGNSVEGTLISVVEDKVVFRRSLDGKVCTMALNNFSAADRMHIKQEQAAGNLSEDALKLLDPLSVKSVTKDPRHFNASQRIDGELEKYWQTKGIEPRPIVDDATYLRRTYLKIIGRIPSYEEAVEFLNNDSPNKRSDLFDQLLDSPGFVSHNFNLWADILRVRTNGKEGSRYGGVYYLPWLKEQIRLNVPYDDFVKSLLTADGYPWDNPAAAYYLRDFGMPLDNMSMTAQIFLGTQLQCAQCHDHPTDVWTQKDFYELSAFTFGRRTGIRIPKDTPELKSVHRDLRILAKEQNGGKVPGRQAASPLSAGQEFFYPLRWKVQHTEKPLKLPHDYQYDDAKPNEVVEPKVLFGQLNMTELHNSEARVASYADWMVSQNNERFTKVIANRMWKRAMGKGMIEPVDNLTNESVAESPKVMALLESIMQAVYYDLKQYLRVLYNTDYFQREAVIDNPDLDDDYHFEGPTFERMSSEQFWDSLATLMSPDIDKVLTPTYTAVDRGVIYSSDQKPAVAQVMAQLGSDGLVGYIDSLGENYKAYKKARTTWTLARKDPSIKKTPAFKEARKTWQQANEKWKKALNPGFELVKPGPQMDAMVAEVDDNAYSKKQKKKNAKFEEKWIKGIRRASELSSPQTNGHLLEVFGQSDRMLIENADDTSNVLQALFLMNSWQTNYIFSKRSAPVLQARRAKTPEEKLDTLYLGFLARKPTEAEKDLLIPQIKKNPEKARERIIWAMLNTQQFLFVQ